MGVLNLIWFLFIIQVKGQSELKCNPNLTIIAEGKVNNSGDLVSSDYTYGPEYYHQINASFFNVCVCSVRQCLRKCCPIGQRYAGTSTCTSSELPFTVNVYDRDLNVKTNNPAELFYIVHGDTCPNGQFQLDPKEYEYDVNYLLDNGVLYMPNDSKNYTTKNFCVENDKDKDIIVACFPEEEKKKVQIYPIGFIISLPFLIVTLLVYAILPGLRSLHGKNLICFVSSLIVAFIATIIVQIMPQGLSDLLCVILAFIIQFSFLAAFFWMNVMSIDIWLAFNKFRSSNSRESRNCRFLIYSAYAWGCPLIILFITMALDLSPNVPEGIKPGLGGRTCWFNSYMANLAYFYGPAAVVLISNCCLFALTAYLIWVAKKGTNVLRNADSRRSNYENEQRFFLYIKLFSTMGVNWITEVISWAIGGNKEIWFFTDFLNTMQGVIIFIICVYNKKVWQLIKAKFGYVSQHDTVSFRKVSKANVSTMEKQSSQLHTSHMGCKQEMNASRPDEMKADNLEDSRL